MLELTKLMSCVLGFHVPMLTEPLCMQPLSLEDLLKKKQLEQDEATKVCSAADVMKAADVWPLKERLTLDPS